MTGYRSDTVDSSYLGEVSRPTRTTLRGFQLGIAALGDAKAAGKRPRAVIAGDGDPGGRAEKRADRLLVRRAYRAPVPDVKSLTKRYCLPQWMITSF